MPLDADLPKLESIAQVYSNKYDRPAYVHEISKKDMEKRSVGNRLKGMGLTFLTNIDDLACGTAYGEEKEESKVDYGALAKNIESMDMNKDYDKILKILQPHENDPNNDSSVFYTNIGVAYSTKGRHSSTSKDKYFEMAEHSYKKAIDINPNDPHPRINLGVIYLYELKDLKSAIEQFDYVLKNIDDNNKRAKYYVNKIQG